MWSTTLTRELVGKNYSVYVDNFFSKENFKKMSMWFMWLHHLNHNIFRVQKRVKFLILVLDGLKSIFCRHLDRHKSCVTLVHPLFPTLDLKSKSEFGWLGEGKSGLQPTNLTVAFVNEKAKIAEMVFSCSLCHNCVISTTSDAITSIMPCTSSFPATCNRPQTIRYGRAQKNSLSVAVLKISLTSVKMLKW